MSDYIKRADAIEAFDPQQRRDWYTPWIVETLEDLPSADVAPVRRGRWEKNDDYTCSLCGYRMVIGDGAYNYCPNCGARMDGESDE